VTTEELERAIDATLPGGCGGCGRSLPRLGVQCPQCGAWPDITREEQARALTLPGELTLHRADAAEDAALKAMQAFVAATGVPDGLRKQADIEMTQAAVQEALAAAGEEHAQARERLAEVTAAEAEAKVPLDQCLEIHAAALADLERAERTLDREGEHQARIAVAAVLPMLERDQRFYDQAVARTTSAALDVERAELLITMAEQARDEQAQRLLHLEEVRPTARRLALLAHPLISYAAELAADQQSGNPQHPEEWANLLAVLHALAGSAGLLALAEEDALPRVLADLTGPLSRAEDVARIERRLAGSRLSLPPGPGEASATLVRNRL
jgi:hypothetical protein